MVEMYMNRKRANERIETLLQNHIEALRGDPNAKMIVTALRYAKSDFHGLINEIFDELDAIAMEQAENRDQDE